MNSNYHYGNLNIVIIKFLKQRVIVNSDETN